MEVRPLLRPLSVLATSTTATTTAAPACSIPRAVAGQRRQQSTTSRTKKALKIPPHPSFLTPPSGASHVVFNPPPSVPSVYHTPFKFLPKSDPRRQANLAQLLLRNAASPSSSSSSSPTPGDPAAELPPTLTAGEHERSQPRRNVTREQVEEMRALRAEDPVRWSVHKLAERFGCTPWFVMVCCKSSAEHRAAERARKNAIRAGWGPGRSLAREERRKRKTLLLRGELS
ncbi:hypothetical protein DL766_002125 [Monosporascus sp. MC13-8B]|uniref:Uncharacterized protein n=1 Tax=Monosporascus cannonballus TaxID=155416 RepID=A0ABY0H0U7_9PEZI|nr:hypothetical protein DL762_006893 [Monosporascus cannonballus]RYO85467.1 hypothetical protein DL763_007103 [Monosporascus cannonballus]RYP36238.1 hypothetical protein DL766_002125 [Monosporascus sp. MC13-8B]